MPTCDHCEQPAIYHDVVIVNGVHNTTHLCAEHAYEAGVDLGPLNMGEVLRSKNPDKVKSTKSCPDCGMTIMQYKESSLLGCPQCYSTFLEELLPVIARVQDKHTQHVGRAPDNSNVDVDRHLQIRRLLRKLESAVNQEEYETAATLRDQLRELHNADEKNEL